MYFTIAEFEAVPNVFERHTTTSCSTKRRTCSTAFGGLYELVVGDEIDLAASDATFIVQPSESSRVSSAYDAVSGGRATVGSGAADTDFRRGNSGRLRGTSEMRQRRNKRGRNSPSQQ